MELEDPNPRRRNGCKRIPKSSKCEVSFCFVETEERKMWEVWIETWPVEDGGIIAMPTELLTTFKTKSYTFNMAFAWAATKESSILTNWGGIINALYVCIEHTRFALIIILQVSPKQRKQTSLRDPITWICLSNLRDPILNIDRYPRCNHKTGTFENRQKTYFMYIKILSSNNHALVRWLCFGELQEYEYTNSAQEQQRMSILLTNPTSVSNSSKPSPCKFTTSRGNAPI